ncbi:MAG: DUF5011 domain-containing protein [Clostridia bacterium]|nr:DUF5011 domain-containing protein [Clostridia bacterium]
MRILRVVAVLLFVATTALYGYFLVTEKIKSDETIPVIKLEEDVLEVAIDATNKDLLKGVTAHDEKDGDLSDMVIVESVSNFIEPGLCRVTYAVCDSNNHVATATRKIRYKGYESPKFSLSEDLCYSIYERLDLADAITATDCIEGDISDNIVISSEDYTGAIEGVFNIQATVTNRKGDSSTITVPLIVEDLNLSAPEIELTDYLIYMKPTDKEIDFEKFIVGAEDERGNDLTDDITVKSKIDTTKEGTYTVHYYVTDNKDVEGHAVLTVIIGE